MSTSPPTEDASVEVVEDGNGRRGAGRPTTIPARFRWSLFVDRDPHERALARAKAEGRSLADVMRVLEERYADGKVKA